MRTSEFPVACLEVRWLVEQRPLARYPRRNEIEHAFQRHLGWREELTHSRGVAQQRIPTLLTLEHRLASEPSAQSFGEKAHGECLAPRDVHHERRGRCPYETLDRQSIRVTLPDHVHVSHGEWHRHTAAHLQREVRQHTVAEIDGVVEPNDGDACLVSSRKELEEPLAAEARHRILA